MKKSLQWLLTFVVILGVGACSDGTDATEATASDADTTGRGVVAPMFDGQLLSGGELSLDSLRGRPIVVNFWTTTCVPCIREMPVLAGAAREHQAEGLVVIGVNYGENQERVQAFVDVHHFKNDQATDEGKQNDNQEDANNGDLAHREIH